MNDEILLGFVKKFTEISYKHKNVIDINIKLSQNYSRLSSSATKEATETLSYQIYRRNNLEKVEPAVMTEGEEFPIGLYPLFIVEEQIKDIEKAILTPDVYKIGLALSINRLNSEWLGCAYLIKV